MLFNSMDFAIFFMVVFLVYYILPPNVRYIWLLLTSYFFYMSWNPLYLVLLISCTLISYIGGLLIEQKRKRIFLFFFLFIFIGVLSYYKYADFFISSFNCIFTILHLPIVKWNPNILLPMGISFYILQAIGYLIDVYRKDIYSEKNLFQYALFLSFFPQLVAGPIERSKSLLTQLHTPEKINYSNIRKGFLLFLYGLFCKIVIADRVAIIVDTVYGQPNVYNGMYIVFATVMFSFQIYCDFYGYSTMARGIALTFGIRLTDNFAAPYFSKSVKEFWRRWHISLSFWFKDYVYIPLGGNKKGKIKKERNLLLVFSLSGLWHGASLSYIFWGMLNGLYQVFSDIYFEIKKKVTISLPGLKTDKKRIKYDAGGGYISL